MLMTSSLRHYDVILMTYFKMDFNRVFSQAISRTVNKCYAEESEISVAPFLHWSFNPLIPPGCIPFLELAGLESGTFPLPFVTSKPEVLSQIDFLSKTLISFLINFLVVEMVINQMNAEDDDEKETEENDDREEEMNDSDWSEVDSVDVAPDIQHAECSKCGKDFSPAWTKIKDKGSPVFLKSLIKWSASSWWSSPLYCPHAEFARNIHREDSPHFTDLV